MKIRVRKMSFSGNGEECWIVLYDEIGEYIGTLHTRNKRLIDLMSGNRPDLLIFGHEGEDAEEVVSE